jgi:hypothetical protein
MKGIIILFLVSIVAGSIGCSSTSAPPANSLFTNATTWVYSDDTFDSTGAQLKSLLDTVTIASTHTSGTAKIITFSDSTQATLGNGPSWTLSSFCADISTCWIFKLSGAVGDTEFISGNIPTKLDTIVSPGSLIGTLRSTSSTVVVTAGVFDCYQYEVEWTFSGWMFLRVSYYVSPQVGEVLRERYSRKRSTDPLNLVDRKELVSVH